MSSPSVTAPPRRAPEPPGRPAAPRPGRRSPTAGRVGGRSVNLALSIIGVLYTLLPLLWLGFAVTKSLPDLYGTGGFQLADVQLFTNLADLFTADDGIYLRWLVNSVGYALGSALLGTLASTMAGYVFDKFEFPAKGKLYGLVVAGVLVPTTALAVPLYLLFSSVQLTDTVWAVLIPAAAYPFGVFLARVYSHGSIPAELLESARLDGAGELRIFFSVGLRMMAPGALTVFLMLFVSTWNNFFLVLVMLANEQLFTINLGLYTWNSLVAQDPDYVRLIVVGATVSVVPLLMLFLPLQRWWRAGLAEGSIK